MADRTRLGVLLLVLSGACLGLSPVLVAVADTAPATAAALRAGIAAVALAPFVAVEVRRRGRAPRRPVVFAAAAGVALGVDFSCWNVSIADAGAGVATVLINVQVVLMPLLVFLLEGARPHRSIWVMAPMILLGVGLAGGLADTGLRGTAGTGVLFGVIAGAGYTCYLYLVRRGTSDHDGHPLSVLMVACAAAAGTAALIGGAGAGLDPPPGPGSWVDLGVLALVGQVLAFALINRGTALLSPGTSGPLLLLPSVFAVPLAALLVHDVPSATQVLGCAIVLGGAWAAGRRATRAATRSPAPTAAARTTCPASPRSPAPRCGRPRAAADPRPPGAP